MEPQQSICSFLSDFFPSIPCMKDWANTGDWIVKPELY